MERNHILKLFWISVQQRKCFLHNEHILAASHCRLALGKRCHRCCNWRGSRAGDKSASTTAALEQIRSGCLEEKSVPKSSERKRDTLVQSQENWHTKRKRWRQIQRWRVRETERERARVTSRGLISEANHFEQQRESPGWKISEQEERDWEKKKTRRGWIKERNDWTEVGRFPSRFYKTSPSVKQQAETLIVEEKTVKGTAGEKVREWEQDR